MVTRANWRFHLKPPLLLFRCYLFCAGNQEKKPEKYGAAVANILRLNPSPRHSAPMHVHGGGQRTFLHADRDDGEEFQPSKMGQQSPFPRSIAFPANSRALSASRRSENMKFALPPAARIAAFNIAAHDEDVDSNGGRAYWLSHAR